MNADHSRVLAALDIHPAEEWRKRPPTETDAARAVAVLGSHPSPGDRGRALWILAMFHVYRSEPGNAAREYTHALSEADRTALGIILLMREWASTRRQTNRAECDALMAALGANDRAALADWTNARLDEMRAGGLE